MTRKMLRLYPLPAREVSAIYEDLDLRAARPRDASRPYVILNMVGSVDGRAAIEGKASSLGSETDRKTMRALRAGADAVMVGAGTLRAERLTLGLDARAGPQPLAVIATTSGAIPLEANLIVKEGQRVLVMAREDSAVRHGEHDVLRLSADASGNLDLGGGLRVLRAEHGVELLVVEGGPRLNYSLLSQNLADELFFTLAPKLLGGSLSGSPAILEGPTLLATQMNLLSVYLADDELFLRYETA